MSDPTDFHDTNSIGTDSNSHVILPSQEIYSHDHHVVDQRLLLQIDSIKAYELTLECQTEECSWTGEPILSVGDFPESPGEVDDLMYEVYRWFHDHSEDLQSHLEDGSEYLATYTLIAGDEGSRSLLKSRIALFIAADTGYHDGQQNQGLKQKDELVRMAKQQTRSLLQRLESEQNPVLERFF